MALPANFLDELRSRTPLAALIGRRVKLERAGRIWKGCCPFHGEKTPSFYVYPDHYHCFGCGEHGDAISFLMKSQGLGFMEAVEQLAGEAGMEVPKPTPEAAAAERRRHDLASVLEAAASAFQRRLFLPEGAKGLAYLRGRDLADETIRRFGLGWAGEGRGALAAELGREGITPEMLATAGLMKPAEEGRAPADYFFNRVMFPIRNRRGQTISFGGRLLGDGQPKYVNGPETVLFAKRRNLYALDQVRAGLQADASQTVVVVEGYMDVISLHQAGLVGALAPLGTALTEEQLVELWHLAPCPVLCFDGDAAGARAAARAIELALPHLTAEHSLRIATLTGGEDPDTMVRHHGAAAMRAVLESARPLSQALFDLVCEAVGDATPELRATLANRLDEAAGRVGDRALAWEYRRDFRTRLRAREQAHREAERAARRRPSFGGSADQPFGGSWRTPYPAVPRPQPLSEEEADAQRKRILVAILLAHPRLIASKEEVFGLIALPPALSKLRSAMLEWAAHAERLDFASLMTHLTTLGLADEAGQALAARPSCAAPEAMPAEVEEGWQHFLGLLHRRDLGADVEQARQDYMHHQDKPAVTRLTRLRSAQEALNRGEQGPESES